MIRAATLLAAAIALSACEEERRVVAVRGGLHGLPGATGGQQTEAPLVAKEGERRRSSMQNPRNYKFDGEPDAMLRIEKPGGRVVLVSRNARELAFHLRQTLAREEYALLAQQVISERTRENYIAAGKNPDDAVAFLIKRQDDVLRLIQNLHLAERLPMDLGEVIGSNEYRLKVPAGLVDPPLRFTTFDYVFERDACRLLLIQ
ncbi:MAG: hypothetical protein IBJ10_11010 [Phycisphaerales bacterium]|nr:hypothetical protein [Phycisphaerales bacterium]